MRYLVLHDVDAIQRYVLSTSRLREIRGASALVDYINRTLTSDLIAKKHGDEIYSGGGGVAATFGDPESAKSFCDEVGEMYVELTAAASSTGVVVEYVEGDKGDFAKKYQQAHRDLRRKKASLTRKTQLMTGAYLKRCQSCGVYPAAHYDNDFPQENARFICLSCNLKRGAGKREFTGQVEDNVHAKIKELLASEGRSPEDIKFPRDIEDIGKEAKPAGYIGLIYADGNRMGDWLQKVFSEGDGSVDRQQALKQFSKLIDDATRETIAKVLVEFHGRHERLREKQDDTVRALVPLCGGDDLLVIAPANHALQIALEYLNGFQEYIGRKITPELKYLLGEGELERMPSACAGVVIAKESAPLSSLFDLAHELCSNAKKLNYDLWKKSGKKAETPCLDFQVITTSHWRSLEDTRENQLRIKGDGRSLTRRPYNVEDANKLIEAVRALKQAKFPQGKLLDLYRSFWKGRNQAMLEYLMLCVRAREGEQQDALVTVEKLLGLSNRLIWVEEGGRTLTPYGDLVEIYPFIGKENDSSRDNVSH